jgi:4-hydroxythreonine-4-phosphate dehydrogenase
MPKEPVSDAEPITHAQASKALALALSMGDPAGIGPEVLLKALHRLSQTPLNAPLAESTSDRGDGMCVKVFGDPAWLLQQAADLGLSESLQNASWIEWSKVCSVPDSVVRGVASAEAGQCAVDAVLAAAKAVIAGQCRALVTAPLNKQAMHLAGYRYPGHTELLAELAGNRPVRMMLEHQHLRTVLHSIHLSLREALDAIDRESLLQTFFIADQALGRMLGRQPKLLLAALNPHAGEAGAFGREEIELLSPCVAQARSQGIAIEGPFAADTVFAKAWDNPAVDAVIALYHDQGLIPIKLLGMDLGVNITLGLPFVRSSPDHGTAFDIAGLGLAREESFLAALHAAQRYGFGAAGSRYFPDRVNQATETTKTFVVSATNAKPLGACQTSLPAPTDRPQA